jgi:hypothetical protein
MVVTAHGCYFDAGRARALLDDSPDAQVLHCNASKAGAWIQFNMTEAREATQVGFRTSGHQSSVWDVQYLHDSGAWTTCARLTQKQSRGSAMNTVTWHSVGAHQNWRLLLVERHGNEW